jgi:hypothetical protein
MPCYWGVPVTRLRLTDGGRLPATRTREDPPAGDVGR